MLIWSGFKIHLDVTDCGLPLNAALVSASAHDNQLVIAQMKVTIMRPMARHDSGRWLSLMSNKLFKFGLRIAGKLYATKMYEATTGRESLSSTSNERIIPGMFKRSSGTSVEKLNKG